MRKFSLQRNLSRMIDIQIGGFGIENEDNWFHI